MAESEGSRRSLRTATTTYLGSFEEVRPAANSGYALFQRVQATPTVQRTWRSTAGGATSSLYRLLHRDHLGSVDVVSDSAGAVLARTSFDPFGGRRAGGWGSDITTAERNVLLGVDFEDANSPRGFTDHEQLNRTGFVHMNGRVYDPRIGRFVSADPIVQAPGFSQSYNRYAYVFNSPLSFTDPSGFLCFSTGPFDPEGGLGACNVDVYIVPHWGEPRFVWDGGLIEKSPQFEAATRGESLYSELEAMDVGNEFLFDLLGEAGRAAYYINLYVLGVDIRGPSDIVAAVPMAAITLIGGLPGRATVGIAARSTTAVIRVGDRLTTVFDVLKNPSLLAGKRPAEINMILGRTAGWRTETLGRGSHAGQGYVLREYTAAGNPTGRMIQWHPGGGHHGPNPYWRVLTCSEISGPPGL